MRGGAYSSRASPVVKIPFTKIRQSITLPDGDIVVVYYPDSGLPALDRAERIRNIFRMSPDRSPRWRISAVPGARAYIELYFSDDDLLLAYNSDSWEYEVDLATGAAQRHAFLK